MAELECFYEELRAGSQGTDAEDMLPSPPTEDSDSSPPII